MNEFYKAFERNQNDIAHYGVKGMKWGVINEEEPMGAKPGPQPQGGQEMTRQDYNQRLKAEREQQRYQLQSDAQQREYEKLSAEAVKTADEEQIREHRKEIRNKVLAGVAAAAIVAGIAVLIHKKRSDGSGTDPTMLQISAQDGPGLGEKLLNVANNAGAKSAVSEGAKNAAQKASETASKAKSAVSEGAKKVKEKAGSAKSNFSEKFAAARENAKEWTADKKDEIRQDREYVKSGGLGADIRDSISDKLDDISDGFKSSKFGNFAKKLGEKIDPEYARRNMERESYDSLKDNDYFRRRFTGDRNAIPRGKRFYHTDKSAFMTAFERERDSDISHYGVRGMKWGVINKQDLKGGKTGAIKRGMQKTADAPSKENWDLRDKVERMRLESDYRKLTEEQELYAVEQADKIRRARVETVMVAVAGASAVIGLANGVFSLCKSIGSSKIYGKAKSKVDSWNQERIAKKQGFM